MHFAVERLVKTGLNSNADKDILEKCIQFLSKDLQLRELWYGVVGKEDDELFKASCVLILQRVVIMFVKSKQQILREQFELKARKESCSLRQSIKKVKSKKHEVAVENRDKNDEFIITFRNKLVSASAVTNFFINLFTNPETAPNVLNKFHGKELCAILRSLG